MAITLPWLHPWNGLKCYYWEPDPCYNIADEYTVPHIYSSLSFTDSKKLEKKILPVVITEVTGDS